MGSVGIAFVLCRWCAAGITSQFLQFLPAFAALPTTGMVISTRLTALLLCLLCSMAAHLFGLELGAAQTPPRTERYRTEQQQQNKCNCTRSSMQGQ